MFRVCQKGVQMSVSRNIISFIVALGIFSMSFAPTPVYTGTGVSPASNAETRIVTLILANRTFGVVNVVLTGKTASGNAVSYNWTVNEGWNVYNLEPGKYTGMFYGCNGLNGRKVFNFSKGISKIKVKLCCPSQNKPPHKIWIK